MKLTFETAYFDNAVQQVAKAAASGATLPILQNILVVAEGDSISLSASDLETGMTIKAKGEVEETGQIAIPAAMLSSLARELPKETDKGDPVTMTLETQASDRVRISCGSATFTINSLPADEFPPIGIPGDDCLELEFNHIKTLLDKTIYATTAVDARIVVTGIFLQIDKAKIVAVGTDGKRIAVIEYPSGIDREVSAIIPRKTCQKILQSFATSREPIKIDLQDSTILFSSGDLILESRLIEGEYVNYKLVTDPLLDSTDITLTLIKSDFIAALRRVAVVATKKSPRVKLDFSLKKGSVTISTNNSEVGAAQESMECSASGDLTIAFNATFLLDTLKAIDADLVRFCAKTNTEPVLIQPYDEENKSGGYVQYAVLMPLKVSELDGLGF